MNYLISGASGLVGTALVKKLEEENHQVFKLVRRETRNNLEINWDPKNSKLKLPEDIYFDYIINLSGENIADSRWTKEKKESLLSSRVETTKTLVTAINNLREKPKAFFCSSAIGFYESSNYNLDEDGKAGSGFLSQICLAWEEEANKCLTRTINGRIGIVLSKQGGALKKMYLPFFLGLGGKLGMGDHHWSWISLNDLVRSIIFSLNNASINGSLNLVSPTPISNKNFTEVLGKTLKRPTIFTVPRIILKLILGEMSDELLFKNLSIIPNKLNNSGFIFEDNNLEIFLKKELG